MTYEYSVLEFESEHPMVVDIVSFPAFPNLLAKLIVSLGLSSCDGGYAFTREYDVEIVFDHSRSKSTTMLDGVSDIVDDALMSGKSPLVSILLARQDLMSQVGAIEPRVVSAIQSSLLNAVALKSAITPLTKPRRI